MTAERGWDCLSEKICRSSKIIALIFPLGAEMEELERLVEQALDSGEESRRLDALKRLKEIHVTTELLQRTRAPYRVRPLEKSDSVQLARTAKEVRSRWKAVVKQDPPPPSASLQSTQSSAKTESSPSVRTAGDSSPPASDIAPSASATVKAEPSKASSVQKTGDSKRDKVREKLRDALTTASSEVPSSDPASLANDIESALHSEYGSGSDTSRQYLQKFRSLDFNLRDQKNTQLRTCASRMHTPSYCFTCSDSSTMLIGLDQFRCRSVMKGDIPPETLVGLSNHELANDEKRQRNEQIKCGPIFILTLRGSVRMAMMLSNYFMCRQHNLREAERGLHLETPVTNNFQCKKCNNWQCTYTQAQTRSADEVRRSAATL
jgi:transcription elongation factor S-II